MLLENITVLVYWLLVGVLCINLAFLAFILYRRVARHRYYRRKDTARLQFAAIVVRFLGGSLPVAEAAKQLQAVRSQPAKDAVEDLLLAGSQTSDPTRVTEILLALGYVYRWAVRAFGRKRARQLIRGACSSQPPQMATAVHKGILQPIRRAKLFSIKRAVAVYHLSRLTPDFSRVFLAEALRDPAADVRLAAVLGLRHDSDAIPLLLEELRTAVEQHNDVSLRAIRSSLVWFDISDLSQFVPALTHGSARLLFLTLDTIRQICYRMETERKLRAEDFPVQVRQIVRNDCVQDNSADVRARCASVIAYFRDPSAAAALRELMRDENEFVRLHAVRASADPSYAELIPDICACLSDPRWRVREAAARALMSFQKPGLESLFRFFLKSTDQYAAEQIADEMQRTGVLNALLAELTSTYSAPVAKAVCTRLISLQKTSILADAVASSEVAPAHRLWLMDALSANPCPHFLDVLRGLSASHEGAIGGRAATLLHRLAPSHLPAEALEAHHA